MARPTKPLGALEVEKVKPGNKPQHLFDGKGLFLLVTPSGNKWWRFKYNYAGKSKTISFGTYPEVSLAQARERREEARKLLANDIDPSAYRKAVRSAKRELFANSFEVIAREWHKKQVSDGKWTHDHATTIMNRLEKDIFPWIGSKPITEITAKDLKSILERVKSRGVIETARRALTITGQIFTYAISEDKSNYNIAAGLKGYLPPTNKTRKHMAAITDPKQLGLLLKAIDGYQGSFITQCALKLLPLVFTRPGELRHMEWQEINLETAEWNIPGDKMKMKQPHLVPLSRQAVEILKEIKPLTGGGKYVFPSMRSTSRCMSDNTINAALRYLGFDKETVTGHGFRASARTMLHEIHGFPPDAIEVQLAHRVPDRLGEAYSRVKFIDERRKMMQKWADYLDSLKKDEGNTITSKDYITTT